MIGALIIICNPIATIIWICVMSFVVRVMRLGTEKPCISSLPQVSRDGTAFRAR